MDGEVEVEVEDGLELQQATDGEEDGKVGLFLFFRMRDADGRKRDALVCGTTAAYEEEERSGWRVEGSFSREATKDAGDAVVRIDNCRLCPSANPGRGKN